MVCSNLTQEIYDLTLNQVAIYAILAELLIPSRDCN